MLPTIRCERRIFVQVAADPQAAPWSGLHGYWLSDTVTGAAPRQATSVKAAWDVSEFRVLFEMADTHVWATHTEHDGPLWEEEVAEIFLDPVGDLESYFEFEVNPLNTGLDLVARKNRSGYVKDFRWNCEGWRTAVSRDEAGWCAELAFPFRSIASEPPKAGARWRINFCRIDRPPGVERELSAWSPTGRGTFHTPERFGFVEFAS